MQSELTIDLGDIQLDTWPYRPDGARGKAPAVVMSFGFSDLKAMGLDHFAEVFCQAGISGGSTTIGASGEAPARRYARSTPGSELCRVAVSLRR
jgi:hypothetical protein